MINEETKRLLEEYYPVKMEVALTQKPIHYKGGATTLLPIMKITGKGVWISTEYGLLTKGEDVMYPEQEFKGNLVLYKYGTNFKTIGNALDKYKHWEEEFTTPEPKVICNEIL